MRALPGVLCCLLTSIAAPVNHGTVAQEGSVDPRAIIDRAIKAHGGKNALMKCAIVYVKFNGQVALDLDHPEKTSAFVREEWLDPARSKSVTKIAGSEDLHICVSNGKEIWRTIGGRFTPFSKAEAANMRHDLHYRKVCSLFPLLEDSGFKLTSLSHLKVDGRMCHVVRIGFEGQRTVTLYFDNETSLLRAGENHQLLDDEKAMTGREVFLDYRSFENVKAPAQSCIFVDGKKTTNSFVLERKFLERLPDDIFKNP